MAVSRKGALKTKSQSAMEYLMTYGWAILIIAVVLGALYYLGVFNTANLAPRAQPGSCKVIRPSGPGTTTFVNLAGVCTGQLPLFVGSFDGQSSYVQLTGASAAVRVFPSNAITLYAWVYPTNLLCGGSGNLKDIITEDWQSANKGYEYRIDLKSICFHLWEIFLAFFGGPGSDQN